MPLEKWVCESCQTVNFSELKGIVTCSKCGEVFVVYQDEPTPKRTVEEWLGVISKQLGDLDKKLEDAEQFREKEKKVLGEIERLIRRVR
jgi:uncharacterized Zn finger protein (UPF0148 family)